MRECVTGVARCQYAKTTRVPWIAFGFQNQSHELIRVLPRAWRLIIPSGDGVQIVVVEPARAFVWSARGPVGYKAARNGHLTCGVSICPCASKGSKHNITAKQLTEPTLFEFDLHVFIVAVSQTRTDWCLGAQRPLDRACCTFPPWWSVYR